MKKLLFGICLTLSLLSNVLAEDVNSVVVDVLSKTGSSWDGESLPDYPMANQRLQF